MRQRAPSSGTRGQVADLRLFCFPHAGGSSARFAGWPGWLAGSAEVIAVDLPGHGRRLREPLLTSWRLIAEDAAALIGDQAAGTFAVFGHSLGALVGYEACRRLAGQGRPPALLLVAGRNGPTAGLSHRPVHDLPDAPFLDALRELGGTPSEVGSEPDLLEAFLPVLRTDMRLAETYERTPGPPLDCPIAAFGAREDQLTDGFGLLAWNRETTADFELSLFTGQHFFTGQAAFATAFAARLARAARQGTAYMRSVR